MTNGYNLCICEEGKSHTVVKTDRSNLPNGAKIGSVLRKSEEGYTLDEEATKEIAKEIDNMKSKLLKEQMEFLESKRIEGHIYEMSEKDLCLSCINKGTRFTECLLSFMNLDDSHATYIIQKIDSNYVQYIKRFEDADPFASLAYEILKGHFSYNVNEVAAYILKYVAYDINRFNAQHKIERLINKGVEPLIETILER